MGYVGPDRRKRVSKNVEPVLLQKKFAESLNGVLLKDYKVGQRICLDREAALMLIGEGWAAPVPPNKRRNGADISC